jgi:glycosyltransferase involved in cell wall biosynthesis
MASGLPIACSNMSAMPEILKDAGIYFDPLNSKDIYIKLESLILDHNSRNKFSNLAYEYSKKFSWEKSSNATFEFIAKSLKSETL